MNILELSEDEFTAWKGDLRCHADLVGKGGIIPDLMGDVLPDGTPRRVVWVDVEMLISAAEALREERQRK